MRVKFCANNDCTDANIWHSAFELLGPYNAPTFYSGEDWVDCIEVEAYDAETDPRVLLLGADNFDFDRSGTFPVGKYSTADIVKNHIDYPGWPGGASSMVVPSQLKVVLYRGDWFQGESQEITGPF